MLMTAIHHHIFDDLLIGNFMKTTLHGKFGNAGLYPNFTSTSLSTPTTAGRRARRVAEYFRNYRQRAPFEYLRGRLRNVAEDVIRGRFAAESSPYRLARRAYHLISVPVLLALELGFPESARSRAVSQHWGRARAEAETIVSIDFCTNRGYKFGSSRNCTSTTPPSITLVPRRALVALSTSRYEALRKLEPIRVVSTRLSPRFGQFPALRRADHDNRRGRFRW